MTDWLIDNEPAVRLGIFFGVFGVMATWEVLAARRPLSMPKGKRWLANMGLVAFNNVLLRLLMPTAVVGVAAYAVDSGWGLLNLVHLPIWMAVIASVVLLDMAIYFQHLVFHAVPILWRLHRVHHADRDYDVTLGTRFHPIEILLSLGIKFCLILLLGPPVVAVMLFEVSLNATAMFNHGNVRLPLALDRVLRLFVVTPDMHRVHHSVIASETHSNFGFSIPWWDRMFGTYQAQPAAGHGQMTIGLPQQQDDTHQTLLWLLVYPFVGDAGDDNIPDEDGS
ncbi:MAG: sterol desaturase family protein [Rhodobacterales bacterium]|nr:sterol desaturase family protein [Rhodobacterales bacterium]